ncbi:hypothetical protein TNCV_2781191 [Trichonephila clavipes]|nr:hypothetical protein TNCV_2781191 [Trichonephila clavipes]
MTWDGGWLLEPYAQRQQLLNKSSRVLSSLPRSVGVACFHLLTGHDYLKKYLYLIGVKNSACCPLFHQCDMDGDHLRHCLTVLKFIEDNSTDANFNSSCVSSSLYRACSSTNGRDAEDELRIKKTFVKSPDSIHSTK